MRVLVACEFSGRVRDALIARGHNATSCDLLPSDSPAGPHLQGDVRDWLDDGRWDMLVAHPPCTFLCSSGLHWNKRIAGRERLTHEAMLLVLQLLDAPIPLIALENPVGCISTHYRKPDQIVQPWMFGDDASKATCWWLKGLPLLTPTGLVAPRCANGKPRWSNQTDSGQNRLGPSDNRWKDRSITYPGMAAAIAAQWA